MDEPEHPLFEALIRGVGGAGLGILLGILFLGIGVLRALGAVLGGAHVDSHGLWPAAGLYVLGFACGGVLSWLPCGRINPLLGANTWQAPQAA